MLRPELGLLNPDDVIFDVFDVPYRLFHRFSWRKGIISADISLSALYQRSRSILPHSSGVSIDKLLSF